MSYIKKVWADDTTPISALNMNHIEQGILTPIDFLPGGVIAYNVDAEATFSASTTYVKARSAIIGNSGSIRTAFSLRTANVTTSIYGRIFRNGVAVGIERNNGAITNVAYTEDISGWIAGDEIALYLKTSNTGYNTYYSLFRISVANISSIKPLGA